MSIKNEILQNLEAKSEENVEQKPTKWKEFKTEHPKAAKILKVGAIGTGVSLAAGAVLTPIGAGVSAVAGALSFKLAVAGMSTTAAATFGAVTGAGTGAALGIGLGVLEGKEAAKKFDEKQRRQRQIEVDNDKFADKKTAINNIDSQIEVKIESKKMASL